MAHDLRSNPDPSTIRGRRFYAVDGFDATAGGVAMRALFEARTAEDAVAIATKDGMIGDLYEVPSAVYRDWKTWADSLIPMHTRIVLPLPSSGVLLGRLELVR